jgi:hypothetical protein
MPTENQENEVTLVEHMEPIDTTSFRDPGMRALCILAANLGWGVIVKPGNPALLIAEDGTQKRLPTNTSIRMSVFQTALSTIIAHAELQPTVTLMDEIAKTTKLSVDHARRLYLAVGESPKQHRERVAQSDTPKHRPDPRQEHLTQTIEIPENIVATDEGIEWVDPPLEANIVLPADGQDHGKLLDERPFMAHHHASTSGRVKTYQSDSSNERTWEDGFKDYTCRICGAAYKTPKGVGSHRQFHIRDGDIERQDPAWKRAEVRGTEEGWTPTTVRSDKGSTRTPKVGDLVMPPMTDEEWQPFAEATGIDFAEQPARNILGQITALVAPELVEKVDRLTGENMALRQRVEELSAENSKLHKDWQALQELIGGR